MAERKPVQLMDDTELVGVFCTELARSARGLRDMYIWYLWSDKRPGSVTDRFAQDAKEFCEYQKLFTC